jgi:hypothetical protein
MIVMFKFINFFSLLFLFFKEGGLGVQDLEVKWGFGGDMIVWRMA